MLVRCVYASRAATKLTVPILDRIFEQCARNNPALGISGLLCFSKDIFVQVIEGGRDNVCDLFIKIARDQRHSEVRILTYEEISERRFANWNMGQVNIDNINPALVLKYSETGNLDPFKCSGHAISALLNELVATGSIVSRDQS